MHAPNLDELYEEDEESPIQFKSQRRATTHNKPMIMEDSEDWEV